MRKDKSQLEPMIMVEYWLLFIPIETEGFA
jgi:hypothetical protein